LERVLAEIFEYMQLRHALAYIVLGMPDEAALILSGLAEYEF